LRLAYGHRRGLLFIGTSWVFTVVQPFIRRTPSGWDDWQAFLAQWVANAIGLGIFCALSATVLTFFHGRLFGYPFETTPARGDWREEAMTYVLVVTLTACVFLFVLSTYAN
jgi:hypothetical protein